MSTPADTTEVRNALERRGASPQEASVHDLIERQRPQIERLVRDSGAADRLARIALTELRRTPALYECAPASLLGALMLSAQLGLEPGPLGYVYLIPRAKQVTWVLGYKGMIELAYRSDRVKRITTGLVREGDEFDYREGSRPFLDHRVVGPPDEREWSAVWALAKLASGEAVFRILWPAQVEARRQRSELGKKGQGPWATDTEAMWRKSAVRALAAELPQSPALAQALDADENPAPPVDDALEVVAAEEGGESNG